uniref:hypothetical protein n=1 Tax=Castellaniella defragrans TaxID=75697 RepID=UPI0033422252
MQEESAAAMADVMSCCSMAKRDFTLRPLVFSGLPWTYTDNGYHYQIEQDALTVYGKNLMFSG